jgi:hypothetical protein
MIFAFSGRKFQTAFTIFCLALPSFAYATDQSGKPEATVPPVIYRSIFRETSLGIEQEKTDWRKANDDVGKFTRGHVDILKQEEMEQKAMNAKAMPAKPAAIATPAPHKH